MTDPSAGAARFDWDSVGNLLAVERWQVTELKVIQLSPSSGRPGTIVTIEGTGFATDPQDNDVEFNGVAATVTAASATGVSAVVPAQATSGPVAIDTPGGGATSPEPFEVISPAAPTIAGISPNIVGEDGITTVTGTNFDTSKPANSVAINRTRATVVSASSTSLGVRVPRSTASGRVSVTTVDGTAASPYLFIPLDPYTPADVAATGTIAINQSLTVAVASPAKIAMLVFEGEAGDRLGLKATGSGMAGSASIYKPNGSHLSGVAYSNGSQQFMDVVTLPVDGTYTIMVDPSGVQTGTVNLNLFEVPQDLTETFQPTAAGDSKSMTPTVSGQNLRATFQGTAGQRIFVKVSNGDAHRSKLLGHDGTVLNSNPVWVYNSQTYYMDTTTLSSDGTYTVLVDPQGAALPGSTITIYSVPAAVERDFAPTVTGHSETFNLSVGQTGKLRFDGSEGQQVSVKSQSAMSGPLILRNPDGSQLAPSNISSSNFMEPVALPEDGTYTLTADPGDIQSGAVTITTYDFPGDVVQEFHPSASGDSQTLVPQSAGQNLRATFEGTAGQRVFVKVANGSASRTTVLRPDGSVLAGNPIWVYNSQTYYIDTITLPADGTYTVLVNPHGPAIEASTITVYDVPDDDVRDIVPTAAGDSETINFSAGQAAKLRFEGTAGQRISFKSSASSLSGPLILRRPDGSQLAPGNISTSNFLEPVTIPESGTYTFSLDPGDIQAGSLTATVYDVPQDNAEVFEPTASGDSMVFTPQSPGQNLRGTFEGTAGQQIFVKASNGSASRVKLFRPDGSQIGGNAVSASSGNTYYINTVTLPSTGTYTVLVDPQQADVAATNVTVYGVPPDDVRDIVPTASGASETIDFSTGQAAKLRFEGTQGQKVSFKSSASSLSGALLLKKPDGSQLAPGNISPSNFLEPVTLPVTGTYTFTLDPNDVQTGTLTANVYDVPPDLTETFEPTPSGDASTLAPQSPGQNLRATFEGTVGQRVFVKIVNGEASQTKLLRPDGSPLVSSPNSTSGTYYIDTVTLPAAGTYTVFIDLRQANMSGSTITIYDVPSDVTGTLSPTVTGDALPVTMGVGQGANLTFSGTAGQKIAVSSSPTPIGGSFSVIRPTGASLYALATSPTSTRTTPTLTLLENGTHSIIVNPGDIKSGAATMTLFDRTGMASAVPDGPTTMFAVGNIGPDVVSASLRRPSSRSKDAQRPVRKDVDGRPPAAAPAKTDTDGRARRIATRGTQNAEAGSVDKQQTRPRESRTSETAGQSPVDPATRAFEPTEGASWRPAGVGRDDGWMTNAPPTPWSEIPARQARPGVTAVAGQVLKVNGVPLQGAIVSVDGDDASAVTDRSGRFLLQPVKAGKQALVVEANDVARTRERFGVYSFQIEPKRGVTTNLEQPVWLTALDPTGTFRVPTRTKRRIVLTNPKIPGFEVRIPAGSEIRDREGNPVRELNLTAVPLDRTPFPLPHFDVPAYFTIQPGGAYLSKGARVIYPNYMKASPTQRVQFWNYDAEDKGWHVYGYGRVSDDAKRMEPDPGVRIWELTGAMVGNGTGPPPGGPTPSGGVGGGDPVDLGTGLFVEKSTDLYVPDVIPAVVERTYRPGDSNIYAFGRGTTSLYDTRVWSPTDGDDNPQVIQPDGSVVHYQRMNPEANYWDGVYEPLDATGKFVGAKLERNDDFGFDLRFRDGTTYLFGNYSPLLGVRDAAGNELTIYRGGADRGPVEQVTTPNGRWIRFEYDAWNRVSRAFDNAGRETLYSYTVDAAHRLATITDVNGGVSSRTYDGAGQMTSLTDARGITYLENTYDANGRVTRQELADGGVYEFDYDLWPSGRVQRTHLTNPRGAVRTVTFNESQYPVSDVLAVGEDIEQTTTIERSIGNHVVGLIDELGRETEVEYDTSGNVTEVTTLSGTADERTTTATYGTPFNRLTSITNPLQQTTTFDYDSRGRLTSLTDPTSREYTLSYSGTDTRPSTVTDPGGNIREFDYVGGDLSAARDQLGREIRIYTDAAGRRTRVIGPLGNQRSFRYDDAGLLRKSIAPGGGVTEFDYDANGNPIEVVDARNNAITATYDNMDRIASFTDALNNSATFDHDLNGNLNKVVDRKGQVNVLAYDLLDRLDFVGYDATGAPGSETYESTVDYSYDSANRLVEADDSLAGAFTHSFDGLDQLTSESGANGTVEYGYDDAGRMTSVDVPAQPSIGYSYDAAGRLTGVVRGGDSVAIGYDTAGRRETVTLPNGVLQEYAYDARSQVTGIEYEQSGLPIGDLRYQYGPSGQRTHMWGTLAEPMLPAPMSATYDAANRRTSEDSAPLTYDAAGNLTSGSGATYAWNARHELVSVTRGLTLTTFEYDPFGRRLTRTVGGQSTDYLHARRNVVQEQRDGSATANVVSGPGVDDVFARVASGGTDSRLTDAIGSTVALSGALGWPADTTYRYGPFGETTQTGSPNENPYQFTGRENDGDGLYHHRARYYGPDQQRFLSEDPLGLGSGDTNPYTYAANDPLNMIDPLGLSPFGAAFGPGGFVDRYTPDAWSEFSAGLWDGFLVGLPSAAFASAGCWGSSYDDGQFLGAVGGGAMSGLSLTLRIGARGIWGLAGAGAAGGAFGGAHTTAGLNPGASADQLATGGILGAAGGAAGGGLAGAARGGGAGAAGAAGAGGAATGEGIGTGFAGGNGGGGGAGGGGAGSTGRSSRGC